LANYASILVGEGHSAVR